MSLDQLVALYSQLPSSLRTETVPFEEATYNEFVDYYVSLYSNYSYENKGGVAEEEQIREPDLALLNFYQIHFGTTNPGAIKERLFNMALEMFLARQLRVEDLGLMFTMPPNTAEIEQALRGRLRPEGTVDKYINQIAEWVASAYGGSPVGAIVPQLGAYYEALALDDLRHLAYDASEIDDGARLGELEAAVLALPRALFGVDIGFVQDTFLKYVNDLKRLREVRLRLRAQLEPTELSLTGQEARPFLSWVDELLLSVLFDFFDVIFSIRDILQGNWLGLLGLLPFIPAAIAHLGEAARYADNLSDEILEGIGLLERRAQEIPDIENTIVGATGARTASDFPVDFANEDPPYYSIGLPLYDAITNRNLIEMLEALKQRHAEVPIDVFDRVYRHVFEEQHIIFTEEGKLMGYFSPDPNIGYLWMRGIGEETLAQTHIRMAGGNIEDFRQLGDLDFRRLIAHEYIESRLMELGYEYRTLESEMNTSAHLLSPVPWADSRHPFRQYSRLGLSSTEINNLFAQWLAPQAWDFKFTNMDTLVNLIISLTSK